MLRKFLYGFASLVLLAASAAAQEALPPPFPEPARAPASRQTRRPFGSPEAEIMKRAEIKREESNHKDMVERADETAQLGADLRSAFDKYKTFGHEDLKRLERMEKLARKIRSSAGGSEDDEQLKDPPDAIGKAVSRLADVSGKLKESVSKSSRLVVSGAVIERSNELIELIRHIRTFVKP